MSNNSTDIELPISRTNILTRNTASRGSNVLRTCVPYISHVLRRWYKLFSAPAIQNPLPQVEDFRRGYPRFTALIGAHWPFFLCRRFTTTRARILLIKQDRVSILEQELELVDREESLELFLGNSRRDQNPRRKEVLEKLCDALSDYDDFVQRCHTMLSYTSPQTRDVVSLENWIERTASLARNESAYLARKDDLLSVTTPIDSTLVGFEQFCENRIIAVYKWFKKHPQSTFSRDPHIYAIGPKTLRRTVRAIMATTIVVALLVPVAIVNTIATEKNRMLLIILASAVIMMALSGVTKITTWEMFVAAATYATVMVVFVQNQEGIISSAQCHR